MKEDKTMKVRLIDIICNFKNFDNWDIEAYPLSQAEGNECLRACMFAQEHANEFAKFCQQLDREMKK